MSSISLGTAYFTLLPSMRGFKEAISRELNGAGGVGRSAGRTAGGGFSSGFTSVIGGGAIAGAIGGVTAAATQALGGVIERGFAAAKGSVIDFNAQLEQAGIAFGTMLGSGKKAQSFLGDLQQFAKTTPFEFPDLVTASQRLLAMGVKAKNVIPYMTGIGDAVAGLGGGADKIDQVVTAIGQINAKGKVQGDEIMQLTEAGIPALKILADSYGVTTGQIQKMISAGDVASSKAVPALIAGFEKGTKSVKGFGGLMEKQSQTFTGAMSNIADATNQTLATAFKPLFDVASKGLQQLASTLSTPEFSAFAARFAAGLKTAIGNIQTLAGAAGPTFQGLAKTFAPLIADVIRVGTVIRTNLVAGVKAAQPAFAQVAAALPGLINGIASAVGPILVTLSQGFRTLAPIVGQMLATLIPAVTAVVTAVGPVVNQIIGGLIKVAASIFSALQPVVQFLGIVLPPVIQGVAAVLIPVFNTIVSTLQGAFGIIGGIFTALVGLLTGDWSKAWDGVQQVVAGAVQIVVGLVQGLLAPAKAPFEAFMGYLNGPFQGVWKGLVSTVSGAIGAVIGFVQKLPGRAIAALTGLGSLLVSSGKSLIQGFIDGIKSMLKPVGDAVGGVMDFVAGFFPRSPAKRGPLAGSGWRKITDSGGALFGEFAGGFTDGVKDFASGVGGMLPTQLTANVAASTANLGVASTTVLIGNKTNVRLEDLVDIRIARSTAEETRARRLGFQKLAL